MIFPMAREESEGNNKETPDIRPHGLGTEFSALFDQRIVSTILRNRVAKTRRRDMSHYHGWRPVELIPVLGTNPECDLAEVACTLVAMLAGVWGPKDSKPQCAAVALAGSASKIGPSGARQAWLGRPGLHCSFGRASSKAERLTPFCRAPPLHSVRRNSPLPPISPIRHRRHFPPRSAPSLTLLVTFQPVVSSCPLQSLVFCVCLYSLLSCLVSANSMLLHCLISGDAIWRHRGPIHGSS